MSVIVHVISLMFSSTNIGRFGESEWELHSVTRSSELGSEQRVSFKKIQREEREKQVEKRALTAEETLRWKEEWFLSATMRIPPDELNRLEKQVQQAEAKADKLQKSLDEKGRELKRLEAQLEEKSGCYSKLRRGLSKKRLLHERGCKGQRRGCSRKGRGFKQHRRGYNKLK